MLLINIQLANILHWADLLLHHLLFHPAGSSLYKANQFDYHPSARAIITTLNHKRERNSQIHQTEQDWSFTTADRCGIGACLLNNLKEPWYKSASYALICQKMCLMGFKYDGSAWMGGFERILCRLVFSMCLATQLQTPHIIHVQSYNHVRITEKMVQQVLSISFAFCFVSFKS